MPGRTRTTKSFDLNRNGNRRRDAAAFGVFLCSGAVAISGSNKHRTLINRMRQAATDAVNSCHAARNLRNSNPGIQRLGDDPPLLLRRSAPAASYPVRISALAPVV